MMRILLLRIIFFIFWVLFPFWSVKASNEDIVPILEKELNLVEGTDRFYLLSELSELYIGLSYDKSFQYGNMALSQARTLKNHLLEAKALETLGEINLKRQEWGEAIQYFAQAAELNREQKKHGCAVEVFFRISRIYQQINDFDKSLKTLRDGFTLVRDSNSLAGFNTRFGYVYYRLNHFDTALFFFRKALDYYERKHFFYKRIEVLEYIGILYKDWGKYDESLVSFRRSLQLYQELKDEIGVVNSFFQISEVFFNAEQYDSSMHYLHDVLKSSTRLKQKEILTRAHLLMGEIYQNQMQWSRAINSFNTSVEIAKEINSNTDLIKNYQNLHAVYLEIGDYKKALEYYSNSITVKDFFQGSSDLVSEMETKYAIEKNEQELKMQQRENELQHLKLSKQKNMLLLSIVGFVLLLVIIGLIYRQSVQRKRTNVILEQQKEEILAINEELKQQAEEILTQKELLQNAYKTIEQTNLELMDNIRYAERIQGSILPQEHYISSLLPNHFIFFRPKDILSGDFYWVQDYSPRQSQSTDPNHVLVAAVDCTGHGVSGALLSIVGNNLLNQALFEHHLSKPSDILHFMHNEVFKIWELSQVKTEIRIHDGMDMALINIDRKRMVLSFAGARNPIILIRKNELMIHTATKQAIGETSISEVKFENKEIPIQEGDVIYLFSDGYADQFGGKKNKKFKDNQFEQLLLSVCEKPMNEQKQIIHKTFDEWKGQNDQVDDVLVIGVRI